MATVLLVNPAPLKGPRMKARKKPRSAAQRAATKRMIAARRASSKPAQRARRSNPAPARKRRQYTSKPAASVAGRVLRYRRKNPAGGIGDYLTGTVVPSAIGGASMLAFDVLAGVLPLPPALRTATMKPVIQVVGAVAMGLLASSITSRKTAQQIGAGALTVALYNVGKSALVTVGQGKIPGLAEYVGEYINAYEDGAGVPALGYQDSGMQVGGDMELMPDGSVNEYAMAGYETGVYR